MRGHDGRRVVRRLQPGRIADRHGIIGPDRPASGMRRPPRKSRSCADTRPRCGRLRSARTDRASSPASLDRTARLWDTATGREITVLRGHEAEIDMPAFSPDGTRIVTASGDRTARLWDVRVPMMRTQAPCRSWTRLAGLTAFTRDDMRLAGYPDEKPLIDACGPVN